MFNPSLCRLGYRLALGDSGVGAVTHIQPDLIVASVGVLLAFEGLYMPVAILVEVIDDPSLFNFARRGFPFALAYRHVTLPWWWFMSQYVAKLSACEEKAYFFALGGLTNRRSISRAMASRQNSVIDCFPRTATMGRACAASRRSWRSLDYRLRH